METPDAQLCENISERGFAHEILLAYSSLVVSDTPVAVIATQQHGVSKSNVDLPTLV